MKENENSIPHSVNKIHLEIFCARITKVKLTIFGLFIVILYTTESVLEFKYLQIDVLSVYTVQTDALKITL